MSTTPPSPIMIITHGLYPVPGHTVSGNGIRGWSLALGLVNQGFKVLYATPMDTVWDHDPRTEVTLIPFRDKTELHHLIQEHQPAVMIVGYWAYMHLLPATLDIPVVMDLLAPWLLESSFQQTCDMEIEAIDYIKCLNRADYFVCCTQRQKAFHTAWLLMSGIDIQDEPLAVIPISTDPNLPERPLQEEQHPTANPPVTFIYGGVLWPWRAPQTWITELLELLADDGRGCLQLVTGKYPLHEASSSAALQLPTGPRYEAVLRQSELLPYDEMTRLYLQAQVGIELSARNPEREFSFSFRLIDYLRCGLPVICNDFLEAAELIQRCNAGWVLDSNDPGALKQIVNQILSNPRELAQKSANARQLAQTHFNLYQTIEPLAAFCARPRHRSHSTHFLLSLIRHDHNVHDLQTRLAGLQTQLTDKDDLLNEQQARISQLQTQIADMASTHAKAISWHETTATVLYQHFEETRRQLIHWQDIAEARRLTARLKRRGRELLQMLPFFKTSSQSPESDPRLSETCLFQAAARRLRLDLHTLQHNLPRLSAPDLLKAGSQPFEYQQTALERFLAQIDVQGKIVLEVGADDAVVLSRLAEQGMALGLGINNWYWQNRHPKTIKLTDKIIMSWGDIHSLPLTDASFDIILTIAAFEHIQELDQALLEMHRLLKPGGTIYSFYGPVWSSADGHHLWFERQGLWYRFSEPETVRTILEPYQHLLLDRREMEQKLRQTWDPAATGDFLYQIYDNHHINRLMYADYVQMFQQSGFEIVMVNNYSPVNIDPAVKAQLEHKYGAANDFTCATMEVVLRKPGAVSEGNPALERPPKTEAVSKSSSGLQAGVHSRLRRTIDGTIRAARKLGRGCGLLYRALLWRLLVPLWRRRGRHNLAVVTRDDVFPVDHGAAAKIYHTARVLSDHYDEVFLITLNRDKFYIFKQGHLTEELFPRRLRELWYPGEEVLRKKLTDAGIPNKESFLFFPLLDPNFKLRVLYVALQKRISIYQAEFPAFLDACTWAWRVFGGQRAIVAHNIEFQRISDTYHLPAAARNYLREHEVRLCNMADRVITVSHQDTQGLIAAGVDDRRITMIPHGVDLENFDTADSDPAVIRARYHIGADEIVLVFHGIYTYAPNGEAASLIGSRILPGLNQRGYFPKCLAVGKYPPEQSNHPDLMYTDVVPHVAPYLKAADIAIVPLLDGGGTRMKILEYFAAAIPVIATSKGAEGIEVVAGQDLIIVDDMDQFMAAIIQLIDNQICRQELGRAGRIFVEQLDWQKIGQKYAALYDH